MTKKIIAVLFAAASCVSAFAGELTDAANFFGPRAAEVNAVLTGEPVWIETMVETPAGGLKEYADRKVTDFGSRGFLLVITTQPRAWRVSMNPIGLASAEAVRQAGDVMVAKIKRGQIAEGAIGISRDLTALIVPPKPRAVAVERDVQQQPAAPQENDFPWMWFWITFTVLAVVTFSIALCYARGRHERERLEKIERERSNAADRRLEQAARERNQKPPAPSVSPAEADEYFSRYSRESRQTIIHKYRDHPSYSRGLIDDPVGFYLFMTMMQQQPVYAQPILYRPSQDTGVIERVERRASRDPDPEPTRYSEPSRYEPPSSSDSSGGSGSFDSGSSSSSDSSGAGGDM